MIRLDRKAHCRSATIRRRAIHLQAALIAVLVVACGGITTSHLSSSARARFPRSWLKELPVKGLTVNHIVCIRMKPQKIFENVMNAFPFLRQRSMIGILTSPITAAMSGRSFSSETRSIQAIIEGSRTREEPKSFLNGLTRTAIHRMRLAELRTELEHRRMDTSGPRRDLIPRLLDSLPTDDQPLDRSHKGASVEHNEAQRESQDYVDPGKRYALQIKGLSSLSSNGTGIGIVLVDEENPSVFWEARKYLHGNRSVFEAEYSAVVLAMRYAARRGARHVALQLDHDVIQQQIMGTYPVERESLKGLYWQFVNHKEGIESFSAQLISSDINARATDLAKKALATCKSLNLNDPHDPLDVHFLKTPNGSTDSPELDQSPHVIDPNTTYLLQFDGGARGNPIGIAGAGMVLYDDQGKEIWCGWCYLDQMSNNAAEYWALLLGLKCAWSLGIRKIVCQGDSELIVKQMTGKYRVKDAKLKQLFEPTIEVVGMFDSISIEHIYRNRNERADWLANYAMDTRTNHGFEEV